MPVSSQVRSFGVSVNEVAGVMDGLLGRESASGGGEGSGSIAQSDVRPEADNPPDYDYDFV